MSKKRLAKQLWYGSEIDHEGNPVPPVPAVDGDNLSGLIEGEIYIHNHPDKPSLFIRTTDGKIHQVTGMDFDVLGQLFLSKTKDDRSKGLIASDKGFEAGEFTSGATGVGVYQNADGRWVIETDNLSVRRKFSANEVEIQTTNHIGGQTMLTAASMVVDRVEVLSDRYRCFFRKKDGEGNVVRNQLKVGDQAFCNTFNLEKQADGAIGNHYYWREVVEVSANNWNEDYYYVDLSKTKCSSGSSEPKQGDKVVQLGYSKNDDANRQNAIIIAGAGTGSPYIQLFVGIKSFVLPEPEQLKPGDNRLSGRLTIKEGSTGWSNLEGLPDSIQNAVDLANKAQETIDKTSVGAVNLLRNSGFTGDYQSEDMITADHLGKDTELFSRKLDKWDGDAVVYADTNAVSGYSAQLGALSQSVKELITNESYVVSFKARGSSVVVTCGDFKQNVAVTSSYKTYSVKFTFSGSKTFEVEGNARICDLQLERGTIATDWNPSPYDNDKVYAEFQALKYLQDAIVNGSTNILGGLILSSILKLGNYKNGVMQKVNAGMSGIYNNDDDVAFWAGGTLEQAIKTIIKFKENPQYNPTEEEWRRLASFVVSHGGDAIFKGSVFADNGYFRGLVYALGGLIGGFEIGSDRFFSDFIESQLRKVVSISKGGVNMDTYRGSEQRSSVEIGTYSGAALRSTSMDRDVIGVHAVNTDPDGYALRSDGKALFMNEAEFMGACSFSSNSFPTADTISSTLTLLTGDKNLPSIDEDYGSLGSVLAIVNAGSSGSLNIQAKNSEMIFHKGSTSGTSSVSLNAGEIGIFFRMSESVWYYGKLTS